MQFHLERKKSFFFQNKGNDFTEIVVGKRGGHFSWMIPNTKTQFLSMIFQIVN